MPQEFSKPPERKTKEVKAEEVPTEQTSTKEVKAVAALEETAIVRQWKELPDQLEALAEGIASGKLKYKPVHDRLKKIAEEIRNLTSRK